MFFVDAFYAVHQASLVAQLVKNLPAMQETGVLSLSQEDPLEEGMATTPVFLPGEFHGERSLMGYSPCGHKESDTNERLSTAHAVHRQKQNQWNRKQAYKTNTL